MRHSLTVLIALFGVLFIGATFTGQKQDPAGRQVIPYYPMQESQSVPGSTVKSYFATAGAQKWAVVDSKTGLPTAAKAIRIALGATTGDVIVHLVDNPAGTYDKYTFEAGTDRGIVFDTIVETGTTINLDSIYVLE